jgi:hypothetical protein
VALASAAAIAFFYSHGWLLYYGDAEAHLNIARRIVDSQTPGYDQLGTPWLPVPHLLMLPFVIRDTLWRNGLAGAIPSGICLVAAGAFLFLAVRRVFGGDAPAFAAAAAFALNPNVLVPRVDSHVGAGFLGRLDGALVRDGPLPRYGWLGRRVGQPARRRRWPRSAGTKDGF